MFQPLNQHSHNRNDQAVYNIKENQVHLMITKEEGILADAGYVTPVGYENFICCKKRPRGGELTHDEELFNTSIAKHRIVVENVFASIKKWKICSDIIRLPVHEAEQLHHQVWVIASGLHNIYGTPLRELKH